MKKFFLIKIKYLLVGGICQAIDYLTTILIFYNSNKLFVANLVGYLLGSLVSYFGHSRFTFKSTSRNLSSIKQILSFNLTCFSGLVVGYLIIKLNFMIGIDIRYAKLIQLAFIAIFQYLLNSRITFRKNWFYYSMTSRIRYEGLFFVSKNILEIYSLIIPKEKSWIPERKKLKIIIDV